MEKRTDLNLLMNETTISAERPTVINLAHQDVFIMQTPRPLKRISLHGAQFMPIAGPFRV